MARLLPVLGAALVIGSLLAAATANAQSAPSFACETHDLLIGAAEMNGLRVSCSVSGAPAGDQVLRVVSDGPQPLCEASLSGGVARCVGTLISSGQSGQVIAELLPSGTQFQVVPPTDGGQVSPTPLYTPVPSDAGQSGQDQPASDVGST